MLQINHIRFGYNRELFDDTSFKAYFGHVTLIQGESGCGKTTLLNIISGKIKKCWQEYKINDVSIDTLSKEEQETYLKSNILYLTQEYILFEDYTIYDHFVLFSKDASLEKMKQALQEVGLAEEMLTIKVKKLSSGEKQRVQLALAIIGDYDIVLCDEITSALDQEHRHTILELLKKWAQQYHKMVIVVSHDQEFLDYADRIYTFENKKLICSKETVSNLFNPLHKEALNKKYFYHRYKKISNKTYRWNHIVYYLLLSLVVLISTLGIQIGSQYSNQLELWNNNTTKNQYYLMNLGMDSKATIANFFQLHPPVEEDVLNYIQTNDLIDDIEPMEYLDLYPLGSNENISFEIMEGNQNRSIEINTNSLSQTIFPYYSKESIQGSCQEFIEGQEGLILSDTMAKQLQIETLTPETSIKMPVYVPATMTLNNNLDGSKYIDIHYTVVDIDVNIVGILNPEHVFLFDSIGYIDAKFIAETIDSAQANVTLNENESLW